MCFSATASLLTATVTGLSGAAAVSRTTERRELPLAAVPLFFAAQQAIEGALWLTLPVAPQGSTCQALTNSFLFLALIFWPLYAPLAAMAMERNPLRRRLIGLCAAVGMGTALYLASVLLGGTHAAIIKDGHLIYDSQPPPSGAVGIFYLIATGLGPALSSHRAINVLAIIVVLGSVVAYVAYWDAFVSVWCFFAAAASVVILMHFQLAREARSKQGAS